MAEKIWLLQMSSGTITDKFDSRINWVGTSAYSEQKRAIRCATQQAYARAGIRWEIDPLNCNNLIGDFVDEITGQVALCRIIEIEIDAYYLPLALKDLKDDLF